MSGAFSAFITAFCAASIIIGALYLLCPDGAMSKPVKYLFSLIFILAVIGAAAGLKNMSVSFDAEPASVELSDNMKVAAAEYTYRYALTQAGINFTQITVCTDKSEDGSIIINKVIVYSDCEEQRIREALGVAAQNYKVEVINE